MRGNAHYVKSSGWFTKTFTASASNVKFATAVTVDTDVSVTGYRPVAIVGAVSNHAGSCVLSQYGLEGARAFCTVINHEVTNKGTWPNVTLTITVLYLSDA